MATSRYSDELSSLGGTTTLTAAPTTQVSTLGPSTQTTDSQTNASSSTQQNQSTKTSTQNMDDQSLAALNTLIAQLQGGGTNQQKAEDVKRNNVLQLVQGLMGNFTTDKAFSDAKDLIALSLQKANEANAPAIAKAVEGAGTSASSMQALLAQNTARDAALASGALGAQQAQAYGQDTVNLANTLEALTRPQNTVVNSLISALGIAKGAVTNSQSDTGGFSNTQSTQDTSSTTQNSGQTNTVQNSGQTQTKATDNGLSAASGGNYVSDADVYASLRAAGWSGF